MTQSFFSTICDLVLMIFPGDKKYSYIRVGLSLREASGMPFSSTRSSQTAWDSSPPMKTDHVSTYLCKLSVIKVLPRFVGSEENYFRYSVFLVCCQWGLRSSGMFRSVVWQLATFRDNHRFHLKESRSQVLLGLTYFPVHKTHIFPEKCDLNSTCVLCAEGKYYFQT